MSSASPPTPTQWGTAQKPKILTLGRKEGLKERKRGNEGTETMVLGSRSPAWEVEKDGDRREVTIDQG